MFGQRMRRACLQPLQLGEGARGTPRRWQASGIARFAAEGWEAAGGMEQRQGKRLVGGVSWAGCVLGQRPGCAANKSCAGSRHRASPQRLGWYTRSHTSADSPLKEFECKYLHGSTNVCAGTLIHQWWWHPWAESGHAEGNLYFGRAAKFNVVRTYVRAPGKLQVRPTMTEDSQ